MCLLRKITYDEFSEFVREKKLHIADHTYSAPTTVSYCGHKSILEIDLWQRMLHIVLECIVVCKLVVQYVVMWFRLFRLYWLYELRSGGFKRLYMHFRLCL